MLIQIKVLVFFVPTICYGDVFASSYLSHIDPLLALRQLYRRDGFPFREDPDFDNLPILHEYDFVVVGAGPAGCVVANRLSENPKWNVLLLEAGVDETLYDEIPGGAIFLQSAEYNWNYTAESQKNACLGLVNGRCPWPSGKGTGGGTIINNNLYTRGNKRDFDSWSDAGNDGWSYDDILPYFLKSENVNISSLNGSLYHGTNGPLNIEHAPSTTNLLDQFFEAAKEIGLNFVDYNNPHTHEGYSRTQATIQDGRQMSAYRAFIRPHRTRPNLHVAIRCQVTKILINPQSNEAYGVEFSKRGQKRKVRALKEVILSAGAFNSPQLLMLSGIGPEQHLTDMKIPVIRDLPVGENLQEHPAYAGLAFTFNKTKSNYVANDSTSSLANDWGTDEDLQTVIPCEGVGYVHTKYNDRFNNTPDIELLFFPVSLANQAATGAEIMRKTMGIPDQSYNEVFSDVKDEDSWTVCVMLMNPKSRGTVRLRSANPRHPPVIQSNLLSEPDDVLRLVEGIKIALKLSDTKAFRQLDSTLHRKLLPACKQFEFGSDQYWECCVRQWTMQMYHQSGTCKMGPESDDSAVVDPQLKVHGVQNLRVIDASVMPTIPGAHLVASVYMIGEKGADMIKKHWKMEKNNAIANSSQM